MINIMRITLFMLFVFIRTSAFAQVTTFLWSGYNHATHTPIGSTDYTFNLTCASPARTVPVSANITSSAGNGIFTYNVVNPSTASPAYSNNVDPYATGQGCAPFGLALGVNWTNVSSFITVTIYFDLSANGVTGPVKFSIDDINSGASFYDIVSVSATTSTGVNRLPVITSPIPANNTAGGGGCSGSPWSFADCNGGASSTATTLTIPAAGNNGNCTNYANEFVTIGSAADVISTVTIKYFSGTAGQTGNANPTNQYIVISGLTTGGVCSIILPVELLGFTGKCSGTKKTFNWTTATEENNSHFTLEKSSNGTDFEVVSTIKGNGSSNRQLAYNFAYNEDNSAYKYYRLKQTDFNGISKNLKIIYLDYIDAVGNLNLYPNPANNEINIEFQSTEEDLFTITIVDLMGRTFKTLTQLSTQGKNNIVMNVSDIPAGSYHVIIAGTYGSRPQTLKFIKVLE
ncbi:MAG: T9SS type A sorting domain-containing protein [Bacteroidia bacterium]